MSVMDRIKIAASALFSRDLNNDDDRFYREWQGLRYRLNSGVNLTEESSLTIVAVYACVSLIARDLATLPLPVYQKNRPRSRRRAENHPVYRLLHDEPNPEQTSAVWRQQMMVHTLLYGNCYSEIEFDGAGVPKALWPLPSWRVAPMRTASRDLFYQVRLGSSEEISRGTPGEVINLPAYSVLHIPALSISGLSGLSPVRQAMQAMGLAKAAEEMGARLFGQGLNTGGIITYPHSLKGEALDNFRQSVREAYAGLGNAHRAMLLEEGMSFTKVGINPDEAQFLETRKFQRSEIASMFSVPPHMIGDTEKTTSWGTGIEQQSIGYVQHTLRPWLVIWEQEIKRKLFPGDTDYFAEFNVDGLLRGDAKSRAEALQILRRNGIINADEWRELENMNPLPDGQGEIYLVEQNMQDEKSADSDNQDQSDDNRNQDDAVRDIATREKTAILRALERESPDNFRRWLFDYYRDFRGYVERITGSKDMAEQYIENSQRSFEPDMTTDAIKAMMDTWVDIKLSGFISEK